MQKCTDVYSLYTSFSVDSKKHFTKHVSAKMNISILIKLKMYLHFILLFWYLREKENNITKATFPQPRGIYKKPLNFTATAVTESSVK